MMTLAWPILHHLFSSGGHPSSRAALRLGGALHLKELLRKHTVDLLVVGRVNVHSPAAMPRRAITLKWGVFIEKLAFER